MSSDLHVLSPATRARIEELMARYPKPRSAILPALHAVQEELGWCPEEAQAEVAEMFGMPAAEVRSLVTFYYMYHRQPMGRHVIKICRSISCWLRGSERLQKQLEDELGIGLGQTTPDGAFSLVGGECLAGCCGAPVLQINDRFFENAEEDRVKELLKELRAGSDRYPKAPESWSAKGDK